MFIKIHPEAPSMIGDKATDTVEQGCFSDLLFLSFHRYLIAYYPFCRLSLLPLCI